MPRKLYRVKVILYVMAENESEARVAATDARFDIFECTARKAEYVDPAWLNAIPYNAEDERTCGQIFTDQKQLTPLPVPFLTDNRRSAQRIHLRPAVSYANP